MHSIRKTHKWTQTMSHTKLDTHNMWHRIRDTQTHTIIWTHTIRHVNLDTHRETHAIRHTKLRIKI
jgi:hypothetical protein